LIEGKERSGKRRSGTPELRSGITLKHYTQVTDDQDAARLGKEDVEGQDVPVEDHGPAITSDDDGGKSQED